MSKLKFSKVISSNELTYFLESIVQGIKCKKFQLKSSDDSLNFSKACEYFFEVNVETNSKESKVNINLKWKPDHKLSIK